MIKKRFFIILFLLISCGKKDAPPSPDIFAPGLVSSSYSVNNMIMCVFSENISDKLDSVLIESPSGRKRAVIINTEGASMSIYTGEKTEESVLFIYGLKDKSGNSRNFLKVKPKGRPIEDTTAPYVKKSGYLSGRMSVEFSEPVKDFSFKIFPENLQYTKNISQMGAALEIGDSANIPVQILVYSMTDLTGNKFSGCYSKTFSQNDSIYSNTLNLNGYEKADTVFLTDSSGIKIREDIADETGSVHFTKLASGIYYYDYKGISKDTLLGEEIISEQKEDHSF